MNIVHISTSDGGGAGLCCLRIHRALLEQGVSSRVIVKKKNVEEESVFEYNNKTIYGQIYNIFSKCLRYLGLQITDRNKALYLSRFWRRSYTISKSAYDLSIHPLIEWADIIHLHYVDDYIDYSFLKKVKKPIVWTLHDECPLLGIAHYDYWVLENNLLERKYCNIKHNLIKVNPQLKFVFLSESEFNKFSHDSAVMETKPVIIHNPIEFKIFQIHDKKDSRRQLGLKNDDFIILFVACKITDSRKGLDLLISAVEQSNINNLRILAVGDDSGFKSHPLVITMGSISDSNMLSKVYSSADCFVLASLRETFSQTLTEAMSSGLPVVSFPVGVAPEVVNLNSGYLCESNTIGELCKGITFVYNNKFDSTKIRNGVISKFSPMIIANSYIKLYECLCSPKFL